MARATTVKEEAPTQGSLIEVALDRLKSNPWDPRQERTPEAVRDLAESLLQVGLLQNLTARLGRQDGDYELAYGMTRLLAMKQLAAAGQWPDTIPVVFRALTDAEMAIIALTENSKRSDLTPLEKYRAYRKALDTIPELAVTDLATSLGIDHSTLSNSLRLLKLPPVVLKRVESGEMSAFAAREFLCLVADDHMHTEVMDSVVREVANTQLGAGPDWRAPNMRRLIRDRVRSSTVETWRRMGTLDDKDSSSYDYGSSHKTDPLFDVEAFTKELPTKVHNLPWDTSAWGTNNYRTTKEHSLAMTCDVKEWGRRQDAAKRGSAGGSGPARAPAAPPEMVVQEQVRLKALAADPVARKLATNSQVSVETSPAPIAEVGTLGVEGWCREDVSQPVPETAKAAQSGSKRTKRPQTVAVSALTAEQRKALGTRDKAVELGKHRGFVQILDSNHYNNTPPQYFPDMEECRQRCTDGAAYGYHSYDRKPVLCCFNQKHYNEKLAAGRATAEADLKGHLEREKVAIGEEARGIADLLADRRLARMVSMALVATSDFRYQDYRGLPESYEPYTLARVRELLGLPKGHAYSALGDTGKLAGRIASAPRTAQTEIAALLLIHILRSADISVLDGGREGEP